MSARAVALDEVGDVGGHLLDLSVVESLELTKGTAVLGGDEVDSDTLPSETSRSTDSVNVVLQVAREILVDDERHLLHIDTPGQKIGGDENTAGSGTELVQDDVTLLLANVTVSGRNGELLGPHSVREPVDLAAGVAEDDGLGDVERVVEIAESVELPLLLVDVDVELLDTFECQLITLHEDANGLVHELLSDLEGFGRHGGGEETDLSPLGEKAEDVVDLVLESAGKHLIGLIEDEQLDAVGLEDVAAEHVVDTSGGSDDDVNARAELGDVIADPGSSDASVALRVEVVSESNDDLLNLLGELTSGSEDESLAVGHAEIEALENSNGEGGSLSSSRLSLSDDVELLDEGHDRALLNSGGLLESVGVDTPEKVLKKTHVVEVVHNLIVVALELLLHQILIFEFTLSTSWTLRTLQ